MNRIYYIRDHKNIRQQDDGSFTRGNPIAIIVTELNKVDNTIKYAVSVAHSKDSFSKKMGRQIAEGRLNKKPIILAGIPENGHKITEKVMKDFVSSWRPWDTENPARTFANEWIERAAVAKNAAHNG